MSISSDTMTSVKAAALRLLQFPNIRHRSFVDVSPFDQIVEYTPDDDDTEDQASPVHRDHVQASAGGERRNCEKMSESSVVASLQIDAYRTRR